MSDSTTLALAASLHDELPDEIHTAPAERPTVFVYGPQGSGKGTHAEYLRETFGLAQVIDDWHDGQPWPTIGALVLTICRPPFRGAADHACLDIEEAVAKANAAHGFGRTQPPRRPAAPPARVSASTILRDAAAAIDARAALRDCPDGERSMGRCVAAFNAITGRDLTEVEGWHFMELLKLARATAGAHHLDDHTDRGAYAALAGEAAERAQA